MRQLGKTGINVYPLCLGGNVFGWSADESQSFAVLDAYVEAGGNFIDTADVYSEWSAGGGGISETIIGKWMKARGNRDQVVIATKVGQLSTAPGLSAQNIRKASEDSLQRLQTDYIDLYFAHRDDANTALDETLGAFNELITAGKIRSVGASNYSPERLEESFKVSEQAGLARYEVLQPEYNLMDRSGYEDQLAGVAGTAGIGVVPYFSLAKGFLTGKYRPGVTVDSVRAGGAQEYLDDRGARVLDALDKIATAHTTTVAAVALAWLAAQPTISAPIASARTPEQVADLMPMGTVELSKDELEQLTHASTLAGP